MLNRTARAELLKFKNHKNRTKERDESLEIQKQSQRIIELENTLTALGEKDELKWQCAIINDLKGKLKELQDCRSSA